MASEYERQPFSAVEHRAVGGGRPDLSQPARDRYRRAENYLEFDERMGPTGFDAPPRRPQAMNGHGPDPHEEFDDELDYDAYFDDDDDDDELIDSTSNITRSALEWAVVLVGAVLVALLLRASLFQAFYIPSESMETTLSINDRVLVNKVSYRLHDINRGDIIVFARPDDQEGEIRDLIKRVIALPGETVEGRENELYINGQRLIEPYLDVGVITTDFGPTVIPEGEIFVMGDNRSESYDSRLFGTISQDRVVGRAFVLFWPISRVGSL
jgi:signal peptidase I